VTFGSYGVNFGAAVLQVLNAPLVPIKFSAQHYANRIKAWSEPEYGQTECYCLQTSIPEKGFA